MDVFATNDAETDLEDIVTYVDMHDSPERGEVIYENIKDAILRLAKIPKRGRIVPELKEIGVSEYREVIRPPYRILYFIEGNNKVFVFAILDGRRNLEEVLQRRILGLR